MAICGHQRIKKSNKIFILIHFMLKSLQASFLIFLLLSACAEKKKQDEETLQALPYHTVVLESLKDFQSMEGTSWKIAEAVYANRNENQHLVMTQGSGVLANLPDEGNKSNLFTVLEHGDLDIELDFMMPKGSNSGLYFQGRYEVQLFDSWLKDTIDFGDCGGIYQRFDFTRNQGFEGTAPLMNAAKAPGLWQHLKVRFRAPRFDSFGKKISNARFDWVYLNDVLIQKDVEVTGPTLGAAFEDEKALGSLMIQGDHGPVAFRNIKYRAYQLERLKLEGIEMKLYKSMYTNIDTLKRLKPMEVINVDSISHTYYNEFEQAVFNASLKVPYEGDYLFILQSGGPSWLFIDSVLVTDNAASGDYFSPGYGKVSLTKGEHHLRLIYNNRHGTLSLNYEGPGIPFTRLSAVKSAIREEPHEPMAVKVRQKAIVQRGFMMNDTSKRTHVISVGIPGNVNYAYDLENFSVLNVWHGNFLDVADMWTSRGEKQLLQALGGLVELHNQPTLAVLPSGDEASWPENVASDENIFTDRGYRISEHGLPTYFYTLNEIDIEDRLLPTNNRSGLIREIKLHFKEPTSNLYCRIATGTVIEKLPDGSYAIDDKNYYIDDLELIGAAPIIRKGEKTQSLMVPVKADGDRGAVRYSIIW